LTELPKADETQVLHGRSIAGAATHRKPFASESEPGWIV
jgi:hypothetical protein